MYCIEHITFALHIASALTHCIALPFTFGITFECTFDIVFPCRIALRIALAIAFKFTFETTFVLTVAVGDALCTRPLPPYGALCESREYIS